MSNLAQQQEPFLRRHWPELVSLVWSVLGGWLTGSWLYFFFAVPVLFIVALIAIELALKSPRLAGARRWFAKAAGWPLEQPAAPLPSTETAKVPVDATSGSADALCKLWVYGIQIPRFDEAIAAAKAAKVRLDAAFAKAIEGPLDDATNAELNNQIFAFMEALTTADSAYEICLHERQNMVLNPRTSSQMPIEGLEHLPSEELKKEFRAFHDRVESMNQKADSMRESLFCAENEAQAAVSAAAKRAIEDGRRRRS